MVGLDNLWVTNSWQIIFFTFISCIELNSYLYLRYFLKKDKDFVVFIFKVGYSLIKMIF